MKTFEYCVARDLAEAAALLADAPEARLLAGGMTLIPTMKMRLAAPTRLVDLAGIAGLRGITVGDGFVRIGAMTRHIDVAESADVGRLLPALAGLAGSIGDPQVRHRGTLGGSIANSDPSADYPAALLGLDAIVVTDRRRIPADAFFTGLFETALAPAEIVTAVEFPLPTFACYEKFRSPASRYAMVGVFVARAADGIRVAVTGAGPSVFRAKAVEAALTGRFDTTALDTVRIASDGLNSDMHGDAQFRAHLIGVLSRRAVGQLTRSGASLG